ncbi:hypothetical protein E2C01_002158 [Portunus trituberculatus]|uniref:Uncharacterized protein n=1 Tax=Portunus trituberculatus TaxID=210409 RepID=A0A5B7CPT0_PORTR|nr:hypothetical protein [Portunus trituberculatus]
MADWARRWELSLRNVRKRMVYLKASPDPNLTALGERSIHHRSTGRYGDPKLRINPAITFDLREGSAKTLGRWSACVVTVPARPTLPRHYAVLLPHYSRRPDGLRQSCTLLFSLKFAKESQMREIIDTLITTRHPDAITQPPQPRSRANKRLEALLFNLSPPHNKQTYPTKIVRASARFLTSYAEKWRGRREGGREGDVVVSPAASSSPATRLGSRDEVSTWRQSLAVSLYATNKSSCLYRTSWL